MRPTGNSSSDIKLHNRSAILLGLLQEETISRVRLADLISVSPATVTNLVSELLAEGVVVEDGQIASNGVGRPKKSLRLAPESRYAVGVHIEVGAVHITLTDLLARTIDSHSLTHPVDSPAEHVLAQVADLVNGLIDDCGIDRAMIVGVGVGASGLVDPFTGVNVTSPNLGWQDVPIQDILTRHLHLPVCVDNNVRAMALGENRFGAAKGVRALAFVYGHIGVGAGLVVDGRPYRGAAAGAGEIGHTTITLHDGAPCHCGNTGCLETLVSEPSIIARARELAPAAQIHSIDDIVDLAQNGDTIMQDMLAERAGYLGVALANLVNIFNPELIVLGGIYGQDVLLPTIEATIRQRAFGKLGQQVTLQTASFGDQAGAIGAAALALDTFFYQPQLMEEAI